MFDKNIPITDTYHDPAMIPEKRLALGLIVRALNDLNFKSHRVVALSWIFDDQPGDPNHKGLFRFLDCCDVVDLSAQVIRDKILSGDYTKPIRTRTRGRLTPKKFSNEE